MIHGSQNTFSLLGQLKERRVITTQGLHILNMIAGCMLMMIPQRFEDARFTLGLMSLAALAGWSVLQLSKLYSFYHSDNSCVINPEAMKNDLANNRETARNYEDLMFG